VPFRGAMFGYSLDNPHERRHTYHQVDLTYNQSGVRVPCFCRGFCGAERSRILLRAGVDAERCRLQRNPGATVSGNTCGSPSARFSEDRGIPGSASKDSCDLDVAAGKVFEATADAGCGIEYMIASVASHSLEPNMPTGIGGGAGYAGLTQITPTVETSKSFVES